MDPPPGVPRVSKDASSQDLLVWCRAVGRSENSGLPVLFGGHNLPPLVEIGLTDLPKYVGAPPGTTGLLV